MKKPVTLEIAGARYRMTSDTDEAHLKRLAGVVNERIVALGPKAARSASPAQLLAVVALGLAEDLEVAERHARHIESLTRKTVTEALGRIDRRLQSDAAAAPSDDD